MIDTDLFFARSLKKALCKVNNETLNLKQAQKYTPHCDSRSATFTQTNGEKVKKQRSQLR